MQFIIANVRSLAQMAFGTVKELGMARANDYLTAFLLDVIAHGWGAINKHKLLRLLGKQQDRPAVWEDLLSYWVELNMDPDELIGAEVYTDMVFYRASAAKFEKVKSWF